MTPMILKPHWHYWTTQDGYAPETLRDGPVPQHLIGIARSVLTDGNGEIIRGRAHSGLFTLPRN